MTDKPAGGVDWELSEAEQLMLNATTPEDRVLAMRRHSEAIRNMMQNSLVPSFQSALGSILDKKLEPLITWLEQSDRARIDRNVDFQQQLDARLDTFGATVDRIEAIIAARPAERAQERAESDARHAGHEARLDEHDREIARIKEHLGLAERGGDG